LANGKSPTGLPISEKLLLHVEGLNEARTLLAGFFSMLLEEVTMENQVRTAEGETKPEGLWQLQLCDGLDQVLVNGHEVRAILLVDHHVGEADKETLLFVNCIGHTIPHGRNEKVANVDAVHSPDADANLLAFGHGPLLPLLG
jgi:hypothetical protein